MDINQYFYFRLFKQTFKKVTLLFSLYWQITAYKDGILSYYFYITPINTEIILPAQKPEALSLAVDDDTAYLRTTGIKLYVIDVAYTTSCFYTDDLFAP